MGKPTDRTKKSANALAEIKDSAIILSLGNEYLCQEPILIKIGLTIDVNVEKIREEIASLIKKFPGKYTPEIDTEDILRAIKGTAQELQKPNDELSEKCKIGELGKGLEEKIKTLTMAVKDIRGKVEGERPSYSIKDSFLGLFKKFSIVGGPLAGILSWALRIIFILLVLSILMSAYLMITMDRESTLLKNIAASESEIKSKQTVISDLEAKRKEMTGKMAEIEKKTLLREDKITIMDLEVEIHKIETETRKLQTEIIQLQDRITENEKKIEDIKQNTFLERMMEPVLSLFK